MQKAKSFRKITLLQELRSLALSLAEPWTTITFPELILNPWLILFTLPYFPFTSLLRQTSYFFHSLFLPQLFPIFDLVGLTHTDAEWMFEWDSVSNVSNPKSMKIWHWIFFSSSLNIALSCSFQSLLSLWSVYGSHILINIYIFMGPNLFTLSLKRVRFQKIINSSEDAREGKSSPPTVSEGGHVWSPRQRFLRSYCTLWKISHKWQQWSRICFSANSSHFLLPILLDELTAFVQSFPRSVSRTAQSVLCPLCASVQSLSKENLNIIWNM